MSLPIPVPMPRALLKLVRLQCWGILRRVLRGLKTPRGLIFSIVGAVILSTWIGPSVAAAFLQSRSNPQIVRRVAPVALLGFCLLNLIGSSGDKVLYFSPGEVNFLFPGPFTRRELLAYKLSLSVLVAALNGILFSLFLLQHATFWIAAFVGVTLAFLFLQLFAMAWVLVAVTIGERAYTRARRLVLLTVLACIALGVSQALWSVGDADLGSVLIRLRESTAGRWLLAPFAVFGETMTAERLLPDFVGWAALALTLDAALVAVVMRLDADYLEASVQRSQKVFERIQRIRRGGLAAFGASTKARGRLPLLPWLGGIGPVWWRQLVITMRNARGLFFLLLLLLVMAVPLWFVGREAHSAYVLLLPLIWMSFFLDARLTFDFRGDLDHMDWLKSLPLTATAIVVGQLMSPVLVMTLLGWLVVGAALPNGFDPVLMVAAALLAPFNIILFEVTNALFLLFPSRQVAVGPADFSFLGRTVVLLAVKVVVMILAASFAGVAGYYAYAALGKSVTALALAAGTVLTLIAAALLPLVVWAYRRFDLSVDTPP